MILPNKALLDLQKNMLSKKIVDDLKEFFDDNSIEVLKIVQHGQGDTIKFYEVHFDNRSTVDIDVLTKNLDKFGYTAKSLHGNMPDSYFLLVLLRKKI